MKGVVNLVTYDGINSWYCGVGTISISFVNSIPEVVSHFEEKGIGITFNVMTPFTTQECLGYKEGLREKNEKILREQRGRIIYHSDASDSTSQYGVMSNWKASSIGAATSILDQTLSENHDFSINYCFDTPYSAVAERVLTQLKFYNGIKPNIVWVPHSTGIIHETEGVQVNLERKFWELSAVDFAGKEDKARIGYINEFMKNHLLNKFGASNTSFVPLINGIQDFGINHTKESIDGVFERYGLDIDRKIVYATGRAELYKGFGELIQAFKSSQEFHDADLVLFVSGYTEYAPCLGELINMYDKMDTRGKLVDAFISQEEMMAIIQSNNTVAAVIPSKGEPFGLLPLEFRAWMRDYGPIIIASDVDGLSEQIIHGEDGFLVNVDDTYTFGRTIMDAVLLQDEKRKSFRQKSTKCLNGKYYYPKNIIESIEKILEDDANG